MTVTENNIGHHKGFQKLTEVFRRNFLFEISLTSFSYHSNVMVNYEYITIQQLKKKKKGKSCVHHKELPEILQRSSTTFQTLSHPFAALIHCSLKCRQSVAWVVDILVKHMNNTVKTEYND